MFILIKTNGYGIDTNFFKTKQEATNEIHKQYKKYLSDINDEFNSETFKSLSFCHDDEAMLYLNGEAVYVWKVIELKAVINERSVL